MLSIICVIFATICNSLNDTLTHHWYKFRWKNKVSTQWWNPEISWENKYNPDYRILGYNFVQLSDAWHVFKTLRITLYLTAVVLYQPITNPLLDLFILGVTRNTVFSLFYNKILVE